MSVQSKGRAFIQFGADVWETITIVCDPQAAKEILDEVRQAQPSQWPSLRRLLPGLRP